MAWAKIFDNAHELECTVTKHLLLHCIEMARFILNEQHERNNGQLFEAGKSTADALVLAVGPVRKFMEANAHAVQPTDKEVADFAAGLLYGLTGDNQTTQFETCFHSTPNFYTLSETLLTDLQAKDIYQA